jgi:hypothetical protein
MRDPSRAVLLPRFKCCPPIQKASMRLIAVNIRNRITTSEITIIFEGCHGIVIIELKKGVEAGSKSKGLVLSISNKQVENED